MNLTIEQEWQIALFDMSANKLSHKDAIALLKILHRAHVTQRATLADYARQLASGEYEKMQCRCVGCGEVVR